MSKQITKAIINYDEFEISLWVPEGEDDLLINRLVTVRFEGLFITIKQTELDRLIRLLVTINGLA